MVDENKTTAKTASSKTTAKKSAAKASTVKKAAPVKKASPKATAKKAAPKSPVKKTTAAKKTTPAKKATAAKQAAPANAGLGSPEPREVKQAINNAEETLKSVPPAAKTTAETVKTVGVDITKQLETFVVAVKKDFTNNRKKKGAKNALMLTPQFVVNKAVEAATVTVEQARKTAEDQRKKFMKR